MHILIQPWMQQILSRTVGALIQLSTDNSQSCHVAPWENELFTPAVEYDNQKIVDSDKAGTG